MKKILKSLTVALVIALSVTCIALFTTACDGNKDKNYSVKVVCSEAGFDYTQVSVQWCNDEGCHGSNGLPVKLDANGEATCKDDLSKYKMGAEGWHVQLNLPKGYVIDGSEQYVKSPSTVTYNIKKA